MPRATTSPPTSPENSQPFHPPTPPRLHEPSRTLRRSSLPSPPCDKPEPTRGTSARSRRGRTPRRLRRLLRSRLDHSSVILSMDVVSPHVPLAFVREDMHTDLTNGKVSLDSVLQRFMRQTMFSNILRSMFTVSILFGFAPSSFRRPRRRSAVCCLQPASICLGQAYRLI